MSAVGSLESELNVVLRELRPAGFSISHTRVTREGTTVSLHGALPETMHFGEMTVDLVTGVVTFVDQDHRDGGDFELARHTLPAERLERLKAAR
jgi:hypothetical protein